YGVALLFSCFFFFSFSFFSFFSVASFSSQAAYSRFAFQCCCHFRFRYVPKRHRFNEEEAFGIPPTPSAVASRDVVEEERDAFSIYYKRGRREYMEDHYSAAEPTRTTKTDDGMAIIMPFQCPEVELLGFTAIFYNVATTYAIQNALLLCEIAGRQNLPVADGSSEPLKPTAECLNRKSLDGNTIAEKLDSLIELTFLHLESCCLRLSE
ncbi:hypothetical protein S83_047283, partial [Arachis hypogaea]